MALTAGTNFGAYEIAELIGAGGMGEVYRAVDTTLGRDVAIKALPEPFAADAERVARFDREAKTLASLNHANIGQIFGVERRDGTTALVMELVEGPTLADRLAHGPIAIDEALDVARQMADALEAAHGLGVVHRDLKPANIKLRPDGVVKVLDFGVAKALNARATSGAPPAALTTPALTEMGVLLGTAAYMSPEQARGKPVDQRTDIWAFGCVLYEMLTGRAAFAAEDVTATLARVLERDAELHALPRAVAPAVRRAIELCLTKDPKKRLADIRDVKLALDGAFATADRGGEELRRRPHSLRRFLLPAAALAATAAVALFAGWNLRPPPEARPVSRFDWRFPDAHSAVFRGMFLTAVAASPDGRHVAYATQRGLYLRSMSELEVQLIAGTEAESATGPFFSPDGRSIGYLTPTELKRIAITGGAPEVIAANVDVPLGASWAANGTILFADRRGISRVSATGGGQEFLIAADNELFSTPRLLPDGDTVLFSSTPLPQGAAARRVLAQSLSSGTRTVLVNGGLAPLYLPTGHLLYVVGNRLFGAAFDANDLTLTGTPLPLLQDVLAGQLGSSAANYDVAGDGTLIYVDQGSGISAALPVWVDREGREGPAGLAPCVCQELTLSPDGTRIAVQTISPDVSEAGIAVWTAAQGALARLTDEGGLQEGPLWTADSARIVYSVVAQGLFVRPADGTGVPELLVRGAGLVPWGWTADGDLVFGARVGTTRNISVLPAAGAGEVRTLHTTRANLLSGALSPDGRWLAYESNETGQHEVHVRPFPNLEASRIQVSSGGGEEPRWAHDGRTLFFRSPTHLMAAAVEGVSALSLARPERVLDVSAYWTFRGPPRTYDVSPDGRRFLFAKPVVADRVEELPRLLIVQNWVEELTRLVPAP